MRKIGDQPIYQGFQGMDSVGFTKSSHYRIIADFLQGQSDFRRYQLDSTEAKSSLLQLGQCFQLSGYGSIPINTIFSGMNIHLPAILMFTRGTRFWPIPKYTVLWLLSQTFSWIPRLTPPIGSSASSAQSQGMPCASFAMRALPRPPTCGRTSRWHATCDG